MMICRNDDVAVDSNVNHLREVRAVFESYNLRETYSVTPFGKTMTIATDYDPKLSLQEVLELTGEEPITNNKEVMDFLKESLSKGHSICLHGHTHTRIQEYKPIAIAVALADGKAMLEQELNCKVKYYASPFNSVNAELMEIVYRLGMRLLDGSGDQLESNVRSNLPPEQYFMWYHFWRFYTDDLSVGKLNKYLERYADIIRTK